MKERQTEIDKLKNEIGREQEIYKKLVDERDFLRRQVREMRELLEKQGSETAQWKHKYLRLKNKIGDEN